MDDPAKPCWNVFAHTGKTGSGIDPVFKALARNLLTTDFEALCTFCNWADEELEKQLTPKLQRRPDES